jgi:hypothetical protein
LNPPVEGSPRGWARAPIVPRLVCWLAVRYLEQQPTFIPPMLLASAPLPSGDGWTFELKWDGCRAQRRSDGRSVTLRTRNGRERSADLPETAAIARDARQASGDARRRAGLPPQRWAA